MLKITKKFFLTLFLTYIVSITYAQKHYSMILMQTTMGDLKIQLYDGTPYHSENFLKLVKQGFYDGLLFHRVIDGFMIQAGDPESKDAPAGKHLGAGGPGYTLPAEILPQYFHKKGALAAARTGDQTNPQRRSSGSQFYICQGRVVDESNLARLKNYGFEFTDAQKEAYKTIGGVPQLDAQYTVFGEVVEGLDVIDKIAKVEKDKADRPVTDVKIIKATVID